jgi:hypothetical protein
MRKSSLACASSALLGVLTLPVVVAAHPATAFDKYGCHEDKRDGTYHCHRGPYKGLTFRSKTDMLAQLQAGANATEAANSDPSLESTQRSLMGPLVGEKTTDQHTAGTGEVITPKGVEKRLAVLDDLRNKGVITPEEYEQKRKEIIGEL